MAGDAAGHWRRPLATALGEPVLLEDEVGGGEKSVTHAIVAGLLTTSLASYPRLELVVSLRAGVEELLEEGKVARNVAIVRANDPSLQHSMVEAVLLHVLTAHRGGIGYRAAQRRCLWQPCEQRLASERSVGVLGLGHLGAAAALALVQRGFAVTGWSRTAKTVAGVHCMAGDDSLADVLSVSEILVCLLPLTEATRGLLDAGRLAQLPSGATLINVGRGAHVDEAALLEALNDGHLGGAILDVFAREPLPASHPFWAHERIVVYPHVSADPHPRTASQAAANMIRCYRARKAVPGIDRVAGY